jgi:hypothetical protein
MRQNIGHDLMVVKVPFLFNNSNMYQDAQVQSLLWHQRIYRILDQLFFFQLIDFCQMNQNKYI